MVAREAELNSIANAVAAGRSVFLVGEAGVGKSRLLRAALDGVAGRAFVAQVGAVHDSTVSVFRSLHEWLGLHAAAGDDPDVGDLPQSLGWDAAGNRVVLGIDDSYLLHPNAAAFLYQLAVFARVTLIITVRPGELTPEGIGKLWLDRLADRIEITPFVRSAVSKVLCARLGGHVDVETAERLQLMTSGNALLLRELAEHAIAEGDMRPVAGVWRWSGCLSRVEGRLVDVIRSRLTGLRPDEDELINMVALAESLEMDLPVVAELAHAAESLNRRGVLVAEKNGMRLSLRLAYPLYKHVVAATMPELTAFRLRLRLAEAIEQADDHSSGNRLRADVLRFEAGQSLANPAESAILFGKALATQWRYVDAENVSAAASHGTASSTTLAQTAQARALDLARDPHRANEALTVLDDALKTLPEAAARSLYACRAQIGIRADRLREVAVTGGALLRSEVPHSELMQSMAPTVAFAHNALGDSRKALALLDRCHVALPVWKNQNWQSHQLMTTQAALMAGQCAEVDAALDRSRRRMADERHSDEHMWFILVSAQLARRRGGSSDAAEQFRRASTLSMEADWLASRVSILAQLAGTLAEAGKLTEASRTLSEVRVLQDEASLCPMDVDGADLEGAVVLAHADQRDRAAVLADTVAERCTAAGRLSQAISALHLAARVGHARSVADRSAQLASSVSSAVLQVQADHVLALAHRDADALAEVGDRFTQFGMRLWAAEAAAQSCAAYHMAGKLSSTRTAAAKCHQLLAGYDIRLPAWARLDTIPAAGSSSCLTAREREIAGYAATGLSNRDIADRLTVSIRTVENHLQRAYGKLGVSTRSDLVLSPDSPVFSSMVAMS